MLSIGKLAQMAGSEAPLDDRALDRRTGAFLSYVEHSFDLRTVSLPRRS